MEYRILSMDCFSCPNAGCVNVYQRHFSLEKNLPFGEYKLTWEGNVTGLSEEIVSGKATRRD